MKIDDSRIKKAFSKAESSAFTVYERSKGHPEARRSSIYALGHFEGLKEAFKLLETLGYNAPKAELDGPPATSDRPPRASPAFSSIFQKLRPRHNPKALGNW